MRLTDEPTMNEIDDYDNHESPKKRRTVRLIIAVLLAIGAIYYAVVSNSAVPADYVGTAEEPGIVSTKLF